MTTLTRRRFLTSTAAVAAAPAVLRAAARRRPNVLFIAVDDLRPQLNCYGHQQMISPHLDRLASEGLLFERAYCQQAVCAPSRASLLAGARPDTTKVWDLEHPLRGQWPEVRTLPQHFREAGYTTLSLGKIYHHGRRDDPPGWSETPWAPSGEWQGRGYLDPDSRAAVAKLFAEQGPAAQGRGPAAEGPDVPDDAYPDGQLAGEAIRRLNDLKDGPFFLAVGFYKPHLPFNAPRKYWDLYPREAINLADNPFRPRGCPDLALHSWGELRAYTDMPATGGLTEDQQRTLIHGYYACCSYTDAQIGRVLAELDRLGLRDSTHVVVWGDHGWHLGDHGLWCKHSNFETAVHSPLLYRAADQPRRGLRTAALTEFVDIYPSLCEACGLGLPDHLEGTSFLPLLADPSRPWKKAAFSQYPRGPRMGYSLTDGRFRYTRWQERRDGALFAAELYDHRTDPGENVNVVDDPAYAADVQRLATLHEGGWRAARPA